MNKKYILQIIIFSSLIALVFNHFNPNGIGLERIPLEREWVNSLLIPDQSTNLLADTTKKITKKNDVANQDKINEKDSTKEKTFAEKNSQTEQTIKDFEKPLAISLENAFKLYKQGTKFIDARNREDYLRNHITNSINIPFYQFEEFKSELSKIEKSKPFVIYCNGKDCDMSDMLADVLFEMGYKKIYLFVGGWEEWEAARYPSSNPYDEL